jgi:hypothetical protein
VTGGIEFDAAEARQWMLAAARGASGLARRDRERVLPGARLPAMPRIAAFVSGLTEPA